MSEEKERLGLPWRLKHSGSNKIINCFGNYIIMDNSHMQYIYNPEYVITACNSYHDLIEQQEEHKAQAELWKEMIRNLKAENQELKDKIEKVKFYNGKWARCLKWQFFPPDLNTLECVVLNCLISHSNDESLAHPKQETIAEFTRLSLCSVNRILKSLERKGHITSFRRKDGNRCKVYRIHLPDFSPNSASEQTEQQRLRDALRDGETMNKKQQEEALSELDYITGKVYDINTEIGKLLVQDFIDLLMAIERVEILINGDLDEELV